MDALERDRIGARLLGGLQSIGRVLLFDRRGIGLSDPITDWDQPLVGQWAEDLATVIAAAELAAPVVVGLGDFWGPARLFAARHPDALGALVLYEPLGPNENANLRGGLADSILTGAQEEDWIARICPSRVDDDGFRQWFDTAGRTGAGPAIAARLYDRPSDDCVRELIDAHSRIAVPTLVMRALGEPGGLTARAGPGGHRGAGPGLVDLPGADYHWLGEDIDSLLAEISRFATGEARVPAPERRLCAVLFTDIVGSTERADRARRCEVEGRARPPRRRDPSGDRAERRDAGEDDGRRGAGDVRVGRPCGACRRARCTASRVRRCRGPHRHPRRRRRAPRRRRRRRRCARRGAGDGGGRPGEILVTASVPLAVMGTGHQFVSRGEQTLKGVPGEWELLAYEAPT